MDQFSKVADGVALFLAVGRPGAKFKLASLSSHPPTMFQEKDVKLIFHKNRGEYYLHAVFKKLPKQVYSTFLSLTSRQQQSCMFKNTKIS